MAKDERKIELSTEAKVRELRDKRIAPNACCENCVYAYPCSVGIGLEILECRSPAGPLYAVVPIVDQKSGNIAGARTLKVPKQVEPEFFCGGWQPAGKGVN